jgi:hypothetical protein
MALAMAFDLLAVPVAAAAPSLEAADAGPPVRWLRPEGTQRSDLDRWRAAVGPAQVWAPPSAATARAGIDAFHVVVWNTHVGGGSIERLVADLRSGALTSGVPVEHFALLLQEVFRGGETVPARPPPGSRSARASHPGASRRGIDEVARRTALHSYYVPSMRNGGAAADPEDRGNAILATLPLANLMAFELPLERERRVAISADVAGTTSAGAPWRIQLVNLHLDARSSWSRLHRSFGAGRARQVGWLLEALGGDDAYAVLSGDFNSWVGGADERAVRMLRERRFLPGTLLRRSTLPVLGLTLDHLLYRLPAGSAAQTRVLGETYGSDHRPLLGSFRLDADPDGLAATECRC